MLDIKNNCWHKKVLLRMRIVEQRNKLPPRMPISHTGMPVIRCSTSNSAPWSCAWEEADDGPSTWVPVTHVGELHGVPGSWLYIVLAQVINQQKKKGISFPLRNNKNFGLPFKVLPILSCSWLKPCDCCMEQQLKTYSFPRVPGIEEESKRLLFFSWESEIVP